MAIQSLGTDVAGNTAGIASNMMSLAVVVDRFDTSIKPIVDKNKMTLEMNSMIIGTNSDNIATNSADIATASSGIGMSSAALAIA